MYLFIRLKASEKKRTKFLEKIICITCAIFRCVGKEYKEIKKKWRRLMW